MGLLIDKVESRELIYCGVVWHEACLLRSTFALDSWKGPQEEYAGENFSWDGMECDPSMIVTDQSIALLFPEDDTLGPVLWGVLCDHGMINDVGEPIDCVIAAQFQHFCCDDTLGPTIMLFRESWHNLLFGHRVDAAVVIWTSIFRCHCKGGVSLRGGWCRTVK